MVLSLTIPLVFLEEEEILVFLFEDFIKEYNHEVASNPIRLLQKKVPLSLLSPKESPVNPAIRIPPKKTSFSQFFPPLEDNADYAVIHPMEEEEIDSRKRDEFKLNGWQHIKNAICAQFGPKGLISNVPTMRQAISLAKVARELGLKGKVYYKTVLDKTYTLRE